MKNKEVTTWQEEKASERFAMISPLLADDLDPAKRSQIRTQIAENNDVSERTLYRLEAAWRKNGFSGLRPMNRQMRLSSLFTRLQEAADINKCKPHFVIYARPVDHL